MSEEKAREILGIDKDAIIDENVLRKAYKDAARKNHPDANLGDKDATARFQKVNAANEFLIYTAHVNQKIINLKTKYLYNIKNEEKKIKIIEYIEKKISNLEKLSKTFNSSINTFDEKYIEVEKEIENAIEKYKNSRIKKLESEYVVDIDTKKIFDKFSEEIKDTNNIYIIEQSFTKSKELMKDKKEFVTTVNQYYLSAQKNTMINNYIGNQEFNNIEFNNEKNKIINFINELFNDIKEEDSMVKFNVIYPTSKLQLDTEINNFKNNLFNNIVNKSYMEKYPYVATEIFTKSYSFNSNFLNLSKIYEVYTNLENSIKDTIISNICNQIKDEIEKNNYLEFYKEIKNKLSNIFNEIIINLQKTLNIKEEHTIDYKSLVQKQMLELNAKYFYLLKDKANILREYKELKEYIGYDIIIENLIKAKEYDELSDSIKEANELITKTKKEKENVVAQNTKQKKIASIKSILKQKEMFESTLEDEEKSKLAKKIDEVIEKYINVEMDNIEVLLKLNLKDYQKDMETINSILNKQEEKKKNDYFDEIESLFHKRDLKQRKEDVEKMSGLIIEKYESKESKLFAYDRYEIMNSIKEIMEQYLAFEIDDISLLANIEFVNYEYDMNIISKLYKNNKHSRK